MSILFKLKKMFSSEPFIELNITSSSSGSHIPRVSLVPGELYFFSMDVQDLDTEANSARTAILPFVTGISL